MDEELVQEALQEMQDDYWAQFDELRTQLLEEIDEVDEDDPSLKGLKKSIDGMAQIYNLTLKLRVLHYLEREQN
jgi:hypothetical protein